MEITYLKGVGPARAKLYNKLGIETAEQLVEFYPRDYVDFTDIKPISELASGEAGTFRAVVKRKQAPFSEYARIAVYKAELTDGKDTVTAVFFNSKFTFDKLKVNEEYLFYGRVNSDLWGLQVSSPLFVPLEQSGLMPKYPLTAGLTNNIVSMNVKTALSAVKLSETLPDEIIAKFGLMSRAEAVNKIHFPQSRGEYVEAKRRLVLEELLTLKLGLSLMKNRGRTRTGAVMKNADISPLWSSLSFTPTNAQLRAVDDCIHDMQREFPMNRLVQGDVGSGKTLVAVAAAYFCVKNGCGAMIMAPTELLAQQHFKNFSELLTPLGVKVELLCGSLAPTEKKAIRKRAANGEIDVLVGTQALIQKDSFMSNAGLVVVDEQHRFGVAQRTALAMNGQTPHILAMSATPIPRTLALIVYGDLDLSVLDEMPKGRIPTETYAVDTSFRPRIYRFIKKHIAEGKQAYIVCPLVEENEAKTDKASAVKYYNTLVEGEFKDIPTGLLYGKLKQSEKDDIMRRFKDNEIKLLVSTTVIEVGIDVPNAVVMLIENAEQFGLPQLHQLRGRVGRGSEQSYCVLMTDSKSDYTRVRMNAMTSTSDGFELAREDLQLRGPGNFFGRQQHGLPPLKVADIADDAALLELADSTAAEILSKDCDLSGDENILLRQAVEKLFGQNGEYSWN